jgi:hypothetical protein
MARSEYKNLGWYSKLRVPIEHRWQKISDWHDAEGNVVGAVQINIVNGNKRIVSEDA